MKFGDKFKYLKTEEKHIPYIKKTFIDVMKPHNVQRRVISHFCEQMQNLLISANIRVYRTDGKNQ